MYENLIRKYNMKREGEGIRCTPSPKGEELEEIRSHKQEILIEIDTLRKIKEKEIVHVRRSRPCDSCETYCYGYCEDYQSKK